MTAELLSGRSVAYIEYANQSDYDFDVSGITDANAQEMRGIKERAVANGTYMKAPNGKDTKLNERQWLQVRTEGFKRWFGDWMLANKLQMIEDLAALGMITHSFTKEQLQDIYKGIGTAKNSMDGRNVRFVNSTYKKIVNHKGVDQGLIVPQLKDIFESSIPIIYSELSDGHKERSNVVGYHHYLGKINLEGKNYYVRFTVQEVSARARTIKDGFVPNEMHSSFVSDVSIYDNSIDTPVLSKNINMATTESINGIVDAKLQQFFESAKFAKENSSKVVDENGEPMPVYRSDVKTFTVFDRRRAKDGFFFTNSQQFAGMYSGDTRSFFVNIQNPKQIVGVPNAENAIDIKNTEFDGVVNSGVYGNSQEIITIYPSQIKSATDNNGNFDNKNNDIRFQFVDEQENTPFANAPMTVGDEIRAKAELFGVRLSGKNLENSENISNFAENERNGNVGTDTSGTRQIGKAATPGLDNGRAMENSALRALVGEGAQGDRIKQTLEAASTGRDGGTAEEGVSRGWDKSRFLAQLEVAAHENGTWIANISTVADESKKLKGGWESEVFESKDGKSVIKLNNFNFLNDNETQYKNIRDYNYFIERLTGQNKLFPKDKYQIIGFAENSLGEVTVVMSQPYVQDASLATMEQIDDDMTSLGFRKAKSTTMEGVDVYTNGVYELSDYKPENVLVDKNGDLRYIDLDISRVRNADNIDNTTEAQDNQVVREPAIVTQQNWQQDGNHFSNMPEGEGLPAGETEDGITGAERQLKQVGSFSFMGPTKIKVSKEDRQIGLKIGGVDYTVKAVIANADGIRY